MNLSGRNCVVWKVLSESGVGALVNLAMPRFRCVRRNPSRHAYDYGWSFFGVVSRFQCIWRDPSRYTYGFGYNSMSGALLIGSFDLGWKPHVAFEFRIPDLGSDVNTR